MKNLLFFISFLTLVSCDNSETPESAFNLDTAIEFSVFNSSNEDLLDPANPQSIEISKIKLFYLVDGEKKEVYNQNLSSPRNFRVFKHEHEYRIGINLNDTHASEKPVTYIQWNNTDTDTLEVVYSRTNKSVIKSKVWLNGTQIWERGNNTIDAYKKLIK